MTSDIDYIPFTSYQLLTEISLTAPGGKVYTIPSTLEWYYNVARSLCFVSPHEAADYLQECFYRGLLNLEYGAAIADVLSLDYQPLPF